MLKISIQLRISQRIYGPLIFYLAQKRPPGVYTMHGFRRTLYVTYILQIFNDKANLLSKICHIVIIRLGTWKRCCQIL